MKSKAKRDDDQLNQALEDSFPASDPPSMTQPKSKPGAPNDRRTPEPGHEQHPDHEKGKRGGKKRG